MGILEIKRKKRTSDAKREQQKSNGEIQKQGGVIEPGLYHGNRRVRVNLDVNDHWIIAPNEIDLIAALGTSKISSKVNLVDLKNQFGLVIRNEIAPAEATISAHGSLSFKQTDEWGEGAMPFNDTRPWHKKLIEDYDYKDFLFILYLLHVQATIWILSEMSTNIKKVDGHDRFPNFFFRNLVRSRSNQIRLL